MEEKLHNLVLIGDGYVGKTSIFQVLQETCTTESVPTVYNEFVFERTVNDRTTIHMKLMDTAGQEEFDQLRKNVYKEANIFLLCFSVSVDDKTSYENILSKWIKDIDDYRSTPIILIGTKSDLKEATTLDARGVRLQKKIGAFTYIECSAVKKEGFDKLIEAALHIICNHKTRDKKSCAIQ